MQATINLKANRVKLFTITKDNWIKAIFQHLAKREAQSTHVIKQTNQRKRVLKDRYDLGVKGQGSFSLKDLVILYNSKSAKKKMQLAYNGPFIVINLRGFHGKLYHLRQVNNIAIPKSFYSNYLKPFKL